MSSLVKKIREDELKSLKEKDTLLEVKEKLPFYEGFGLEVGDPQKRADLLSWIQTFGIVISVIPIIMFVGGAFQGNLIFGLLVMALTPMLYTMFFFLGWYLYKYRKQHEAAGKVFWNITLFYGWELEHTIVETCIQDAKEELLVDNINSRYAYITKEDFVKLIPFIRENKISFDDFVKFIEEQDKKKGITTSMKIKKAIEKNRSGANGKK